MGNVADGNAGLQERRGTSLTPSCLNLRRGFLARSIKEFQKPQTSLRSLWNQSGDEALRGQPRAEGMPVHERGASSSDVMAGRLRKAAHLARDAVVALLSVVIVGSQYPRLSEEPVFLVMVSISALTLILSVVDAGLVLARPRWRAYFLGNAVVQLMVGFLWAGLFPVIGVVIVALNVLALVTLRERKTAEELAAHPPLPRTRNYKIADGAGTLVMLASLFLPWLSDSGSTLSLIGVYSALATRSGLPSFSISQAAALFALMGLAGSPVAIACGGFGLLKRKLSAVAGVIGVVAGVGAVLALGGAAGVGAYGLAAGGAVVLAGFFAFRRE